MKCFLLTSVDLARTGFEADITERLAILRKNVEEKVISACFSSLSMEVWNCS